MSNGLKFGLAILTFGCAIPLITTFLTLRHKPVYHTYSLPQEDSFMQFTWQEKPVANVEHLLVFLDKPEKYQAAAGLDVTPPQKIDGYFVLPRGVFYKDVALLKPIKKVLRRQKKDVRTWIVHRGKAFSLELSESNNEALKSMLSSLRPQDVNAELINKLLIESPFWPEINKQLAEFKEKAKNGKIDFEPRKRRSEFMTF